jgi:hypothetical protein
MNENWTSKNPPPELSDEDAELLSAYIDNMLDATERAALESRLETDAFLRSELAAMRQMLGWLKTMPALKAPRNFTISEADVKPVAAPPKLVVMPRRNNWQVLGAAAAIFIVAIGFAAFIVNNPTNKNQENQVAFGATEIDLDEAAGNAPAPVSPTSTIVLMATMGVPPVGNGGSSGGSTGSGGGAPLQPQEPSVAGESAEIERSMDTDTGTDGSTNPEDASVQSALLEATSTVAAASGGQTADLAMMPTQTENSATILAYSTTTAQPTMTNEPQESIAMNAQETNPESTEDLTVLSAPVEEAEADDAESANMAMVTVLASPSQLIRDIARGYLHEAIERLRR